MTVNFIKNNSKFYFGSMPTSGTANIFIEMFGFRNRKENFVLPCPLDIFEYNGAYYPSISQTMPYVQEIEDKFQTGFRSVNWTENFDYLDQCIEKHHPKSIWFATYISDIFYSVKQHYGSNVTTISINYSKEDYDFIIERWSVYQAGLILNRPHFINLKSKFSTLNEVKKFCLDNGPKYFGYDIPNQKQVIGDVNVNIKDIFDQKKLKDILRFLGCECNPTDWEFYSRYVSIC